MTDHGYIPDNPLTSAFTQSVTQSVSQKDSQQDSRQSAASSSTTQSVTQSVTNSLTGARARARTRARENAYALLEAYDRLVGDPDRYVENLITDCMNKGMSRDVIMSAIKDTGKAPRPSKRYFESILNRYLSEGILDFEALLRDRDRHEFKIQSARRRRHAKWYDDQSVLSDYDKAYSDKFALEGECDIDRYIPIHSREYVSQRYSEILGSDGEFPSSPSTPL